MTNKTTEILIELRRCNLDFVVIPETKKKGHGTEILSEYYHLWSGVEKHQHAQAGVSIFVKKQLQKYITDYEFISERITTLTMKLYGHETLIVGVYAPTDNAQRHLKDKFYNQLSHVLSNTKAHLEIIVAGDLNGRIKGKKGDDVVGGFADEEENDNGERLLELCNQYQLKITNTFFSHKDIHRYTWERPSMNQRSIIDYIIVKQRSHFRINDCRVKRGANCGSDHHLLVATLVVPFTKTAIDNNNSTRNIDEKGTPMEQKKYKLYLLQQDSIRSLYETRLAAELTEHGGNQDVEEQYETLKSIIHKIANEALGEYTTEKNKKQYVWLTEEVKQVIQEKKNTV